MFVAYAWIVVLFVVGPTVASRLDDRGLPGARIVLVLVVLSACVRGLCRVHVLAPGDVEPGPSRAPPGRWVLRINHASHHRQPCTRCRSSRWCPRTNDAPSFEGFECALDGRRISVFTRSQAPDMYATANWE